MTLKETIALAITKAFEIETLNSGFKNDPRVQTISNLAALIELLVSDRTMPDKCFAEALEKVVVAIKLEDNQSDLQSKLLEEIKEQVYTQYEPQESESNTIGCR